MSHHLDAPIDNYSLDITDAYCFAGAGDCDVTVGATLGRGAAIHDAIARATVVCRGPKPVAVLKREGLPVHVRAAAPVQARRAS